MRQMVMTTDSAWRGKNHMPLFWGLVIFFLLSLPMIGVGYYYYAALNDALTQQVFNRIETLAGLSASAIKVKLDQLVDLATRFAAEPGVGTAIKGGDWTRALNVFKNSLDDPSFYDFYVDRILLEDTSGKVRGAFPQLSKSAIGKTDVLFADWQKPILEEHKKAFVSNVYKRDISPRINLIKIIAPIVDSQRIVGLVALTAPINSFADFGKDIDLSSDGFTYYVDRTGQIIAHPKFSSDGPIRDYSKVPAVSRLLSGNAGTDILYNPIEQQTRVVAYGKVPVYGWGVVAQEPVHQAFENRDAILGRVNLLILLVGLLDFFIAFLVFLILKGPTRSAQTI